MLTQNKILQIRKKTEGINPRLSDLFDALSDFRRLQIFNMLLEYDEVCVTDVANIFKITPSAASQQLRVLAMSGLIKRVRMGQMTCYEVLKNDPSVKLIKNICQNSQPQSLF